MRVLVVGNGAREHALVWKLVQERAVREVLCSPGNAGIARTGRVADVAAGDIDGLLALAQRERIDLTVVGPELPLDRGIVDLFTSHGLRIFGPSRGAAQLECSKVFAKAFMAKHGIPTARYRVCDDAATAHALIARGELGFPIVVKADGLAAGKGVVVAPDRESADAAVRSVMEEREFGSAGDRVVLEECLVGPELSFFVMCDGTRAVPLLAAQDHKRVFDDDKGPNTGGMGAFAPTPLMDEVLQARVMREIVEPVVQGLKSDGQEYRGFLYAGLMLTCDGPKVIEFNVRFGDPEAQVVMPGIDDDLAPHLAAAAEGSALLAPLRFRAEKHVGVVLASEGYPASGPVGRSIAGLDAAAGLSNVFVFHAGTKNQDVNGRSAIVTAGGRVLTIVGRGATFDHAIARAYEGVSTIGFEGMHFRRDIGQKALRSSGAPKN